MTRRLAWAGVAGMPVYVVISGLAILLLLARGPAPETAADLAG